MIGLDTLAGLLGSRPAQSQIHALLEQAHVDEAANTGSDPEIKAYPDVVYHNYRSAGISLQFEAASPGKDASKCASDDLSLAAIDIYSANDDRSWTSCSMLPLQIDAFRPDSVGGHLKTKITQDATGKDLVSWLGEPQRKGGGAGGRSGPAAWMEWSLNLATSNPNRTIPITLQIELAGAGARGADRWNAERAGACQWAVITISSCTPQ